MKSPRLKQALLGMFAAIFLLSILLAFSPLTLYLGNEKDLSVSFFQLVTNYIYPALFGIAAITLIAMIAPPALSRFFVCVIAGLGLLRGFSQTSWYGNTDY